jgi:RimJ/RimL family protein N-acetyltransferase
MHTHRYEFLRLLSPLIMSTFLELPTRTSATGPLPPVWTYQVFGVDVLLDSELNPTLLEINTNPGFVGRAGGERDESGHFEGLFGRLNGVMCDFMWTSVKRNPPQDVMLLLDNTNATDFATNTIGTTTTTTTTTATTTTTTGGGDAGLGLAVADIEEAEAPGTDAAALAVAPPPLASLAPAAEWPQALRVRLEPLGMDHYEDLMHVVQDEATMQTVQQGRTYSLQELVQRCRDSEADWRNTSTSYHHWAIVVNPEPEEQEQGQQEEQQRTAVGLLLWHRRSDLENFQLRILVSPRVQRRGVASRALQLSINALQHRYSQVPRVVGTLQADVHSGNQASKALLRKCGFRDAGRGRIGPFHVDKFVYSAADPQQQQRAEAE